MEGDIRIVIPANPNAKVQVFDGDNCISSDLNPCRIALGDYLERGLLRRYDNLIESAKGSVVKHPMMTVDGTQVKK